MSGEVVGRVAELWRYPVKSMGGEPLGELYVDKHGVVGDRAYAVFDEEMGEIASAKNPKAYGILLGCSAKYVGEPLQSDPPRVAITLPDGYESGDMDDVVHSLSQLLGRRVRLISSGGGEPYHDSTHIHLITTKSLAMLSSILPHTSVDRRRFRPNIVVESGRELEELSWVGGSLRIGGAELYVKKPCKRCVMTTLPQGELPPAKEILEYLRERHDGSFGIYCVVRRPGRIRVGDDVVLMF